MFSFMSIMIFVISLLLVLYLGNKYMKWKRIANLINKIPGPFALPLIGTTWAIFFVSREDLKDFLYTRIKLHAPFFRTWAGYMPEIHIMTAEHMEIILSSSTLITKGYVYKFLSPWLGLGLLTSTGSRWHKQRKLITPAFHFGILEKFTDIFINKSEILLEKLKPVADGRVIDISSFVTYCTLDIICKTAMGVEVNSMEQPNSDYVRAIYKISELISNRRFQPWLIIDPIFYRSKHGKEFNRCLSILHGFTEKVIQERKEALKNEKLQQSSDEDQLLGKKKRMAFLDLLLAASQNGALLSDTDIREEVDTFMFEGHDTTTASICWTLFLLGNHLDIQDKVAEELKEIFGNTDRKITMQDLSEMKYLERVIKESLRLYPSVPAIQRQTSETIQIDNYTIPSGCYVVVHIYELHRDPKNFPNPDNFNPDNFLPDRCQQRHPFAYVPFSAGPRNCIGQKFALLEEKAVLSSILRKYKVIAVERVQDMKYYFELILRPQNGIYLTLTPRY